MARLMGIDLGERRIGIAVTNADETMAFPERVLMRRSAKSDRQAIARLAAELEVEGIVIGLPLSMDGEFGENAERAQRFGEYLARVVSIPIEYQDERLTTVEAEERLLAAGANRRRVKDMIDAAAAAVILDDYMQARAG